MPKINQYVSNDINALIIAILVAFFSSYHYPVLTALGLGIIAYSFIWYIESLGKDIAIAQLIILIAVLQWLLGPFIAYHFDGITLRYFMYVDEEVYMGYAVPAIFAFIIGMKLFLPKVDYLALLDYIRNLQQVKVQYAYILIALGFLSEVMTSYVPNSLFFALFISAQFKYIGVLYLLILRANFRWIILTLVLVDSALYSVDLGLFHNFLLWSGFIFSYFCLEKNISRLNKYLLILAALFFIVTLQSIKSEYRTIAFDDHYKGSKVSLILDLLFKENLRSDQDLSIGEMNARLNQGWIISAIMNHVPTEQDYQHGETITQALKDSLLPRFIVDKRKVHVRDNFMKYTGIFISENTSMGISILGEAYINFATYGGILFMLVWGICIALALKWIHHIAINYPTIVLWMPLLFLQVVKAETELAVALNHSVKTAILIFLLYWVSKRFFRLNL